MRAPEAGHGIWAEAGRIAVVYAIFGVAWMLVMDQAVLLLARGESATAQARSGLNWAFVACSACLLFGLLLEARRRLIMAEARSADAQKLAAVGRMAGGIAHDFNNVLTVVQGMTEMVRDATPSEDLKRSLLDQVLGMVERGKRLVESLLGYLRRQPAAPRELDLGALVRSAAPLLNKLLKPSVTLLLDLHPAAILADRVQLERVLMNLVSNADDAMPAGGQLELSCRDEGAWAVLSVADNGKGMDEATRKRAFEEGFSTKGDGGTGLGLGNVRGIVEEMGGHVDVSSSVGAGTRFLLSFPKGGV